VPVDADRSQVRYDVVGIGNALVDIIAHAPDSFIDEHALVKGSMTLIDADRAVTIYRALGTAIQMSGGSAANTVCGVASLGGRAAYIGKVNRDDLGEVFGHDMRAVGVRFRAGRYDHDLPTGRCVIVVTPDAQRTMNTYLGMSSMLAPSDLDESTIAAGAILYMEGYLFDRDDAKAAFRRAAEVAHEHGRQVSITLSDSFCVDRHRDDFLKLVADQVDLLFGNKAELIALYQTDTLDEAVEAARADCALTVVTVGAEGCLIAHSEGIVTVPAADVPLVLDTTGAGDLFAAGFLFGHSRGLPLEESARIGAVAAGEVISHIGPRPLVALSELI
jgi:sugar/nucleoside kinase (ribokinase family)